MTFLLIPPYLIFAFFVMRAVLKKQFTRKRKWQMGLLTAFLLYLPLGWDVILGRAVFYTLCATQGGVHVYETVELGSEYWNEDGSPKFILKNGELDEAALNGSFAYERNTEESLGNLFNVTKHPDKLLYRKTGDVYADRVTFVYRGGWFSNYTGFFVRGTPCGTKIKDELYPTLFSKVFILSDI